MQLNINKKMAPLILLAVFLLVFDRFAKTLFYSNFPDRTWHVLGDILKFRLATNDYIAFSLPISGMGLEILIGIILVLLIIILVKLYKSKQAGLFVLFLMIFFGAVSNFYDRLLLGYVIDYIDLKWFTVFNIADAMIVIPGLLLIFKLKTDRNKQSGTKTRV